MQTAGSYSYELAEYSRAVPVTYAPTFERRGAPGAWLQLVHTFLRRTVARYDRSALSALGARWCVFDGLRSSGEAVPDESARCSGSAEDRLEPGVLEARLIAAWEAAAAEDPHALSPGFDDVLLLALETSSGVIAWGEQRLYWYSSPPKYLSISRHHKHVGKQSSRAEVDGKRAVSGSLRMLAYDGAHPSWAAKAAQAHPPPALLKTEPCKRRFLSEVRFRIDPQWFVVVEEMPEPGQVALAERLPFRSARGRTDEMEGARLAALLNASCELLSASMAASSAVGSDGPSSPSGHASRRLDASTPRVPASPIAATAASPSDKVGSSLRQRLSRASRDGEPSARAEAASRRSFGDGPQPFGLDRESELFGADGAAAASGVAESVWRTAPEPQRGGTIDNEAATLRLGLSSLFSAVVSLPAAAARRIFGGGGAAGDDGWERAAVEAAEAAELKASDETHTAGDGTTVSASRGRMRGRGPKTAAEEYDIVVRPRRLAAHLARARLHGAAARLLDPAGEPYQWWAPLDAPPPLGLKYQLGVGVTLYLKLLSYLARGFALAAVIAVPHVAANWRGGELSSIGFASVDVKFSLGNRKPFDVEVWPSGILDLLFSCLLMVVFLQLKRQATALARDVDEGTITPADYTLLLTGVPRHLGARGEAALGTDDHEAGRVYSDFFRRVCARTPAPKPPPPAAGSLRWWLSLGWLGLDLTQLATETTVLPPPLDDTVSELVFVRGSAAWLDTTNELLDARKRLRALVRPAGRALSAETAAAAFSKSGKGPKVGTAPPQPGDPAPPSPLGRFSQRLSTAFRPEGDTTPISPRSARESEAHRSHVAALRKHVEGLREELERAAKSAGTSAGEVRAVLVSFNSVGAMEKVKTELKPSAPLLWLRNAWPLAAFVGTAPQLEYPDPSSPRRTLRCTLSVRTAAEPSDLIWPSLARTGTERAGRVAVSWLIMSAAVLLAMSLAVRLTTIWGLPAPAPSFTHTFQPCLDVHYLDSYWSETFGSGPSGCGLRRDGTEPNMTVGADGKRHESNFGKGCGGDPSCILHSILVNASCVPNAQSAPPAERDAMFDLSPAPRWLDVPDARVVANWYPSQSGKRGSRPRGKRGLLEAAGQSEAEEGRGEWTSEEGPGRLLADDLEQELVEVTKPRTSAWWAFWEVAPAPTGQTGAFNVSDANGTFYPKCDFLRQRGPQGGYLVPIGGGPVDCSEHPSECEEAFCSFSSDYSPDAPPPYLLRPTRMCPSAGSSVLAKSNATRMSAAAAAAEAAQEGLSEVSAAFTEAFSSFGSFGGGGGGGAGVNVMGSGASGWEDEDGLVNAYVIEGCNDPNCVLCTRAYLDCRTDSETAQLETAPLLSAARLTTYRTFAISIIVLVLGQGLYYLTPWLADFSCALTYSAKQRSFMRYNVFMTFFFTLCTLLYMEKSGLAKLGFYLRSGKQIYALLFSYVTTKILMLWSLVPAMTFVKSRLLARFQRTQRDMNTCFEGYEFYYALNMAQILFLVLLATMFSSALPLALPMCSVYLALRYVTERLYFVKFYTRTPAYDDKLFHAAYGFLPLALLGKLAATYILYRPTRAANLTFAIQLFTFVLWLSIDRGFWAWVLAVRGGAKMREYESDLAESTSHQVGRARGLLDPYDPFPPVLDPPVLEVHELLLLRPVATWANPQRLPAFATCPNCFATCAIPEPGTPVGRHRCRPTRALKSAEEEGQRRRLARLPGWGKGKSGKGPLRRANSSAGASLGNSLGERTSLALGPFSPALLPPAGGGGGSPAYAAASPSTTDLSSSSDGEEEASPPAPAPAARPSRGRGLLRRSGGDGDATSTAGLMPSGAPDSASPDHRQASPLPQAAGLGSAWPGAPSASHGAAPGAAPSEPLPEASWTRVARIGGASTLRAFGSWTEARAWLEQHLRMSERDGPLGPSAQLAEEDGERYTYTGMPTLLLPPLSRPTAGSRVTVYDWWNKELGQRTIHAGAPRDGEVCLGVQFVALTGGKITASGAAPPGTAAVCDFWDRGRRQVTLHAGPARRGEELRQLQFYAWTEAQPELGTVPVYEWEHTHSRELSVHPAPPWPGEEPTAARVVFHALPPAAAYAVSLRARGRELASSAVNEAQGDGVAAQLIGAAMSGDGAMEKRMRREISEYLGGGGGEAVGEDPESGDEEPPQRGDLRVPAADEWVVGYTREHGEYGTLLWRLLEASTRLEMSKLLEDCLELGGASRNGGADPQVWECVCVAAELCEPDADHEGPWTRWVAVLRSGGVPRFVNGRLTAARREVDWALRASVGGVVQRRLADGLQLVASGGTAGAFNVRLLVSSRRVHHWARQHVRIDSHWDRIEAWIAQLAQVDGSAGGPPLVETVSYVSGEWTVSAIARAAADVPVSQRVLAGPAWPAGEIQALLRSGFVVSAAARGPAGSAHAVVVVMTRMPASVAPLVYRGRGSSSGCVMRWRTFGARTEWHEDWAQAPLCDARPFSERAGVRVHASSSEAPPRLEASRSRVTDVAYSLPWQLGVCGGAMLDTIAMLLIVAEVLPAWCTPVHEAISLAVLVLFTVDIALRLIAEGPSFFSDRWNIFDLALVLLSVAANAYVAFGGGSQATKQAPVIMRAFRAIRAVILAYRTIERLEQGARSRRGPPVQHRAAFITDSDEGTYWRSGRVPGGPGSPFDVTVTIDLGCERPVEAISTLWGGEHVHRMPAQWSLLGATHATFDPAPPEVVHAEPGQMPGHWRLHEPLVIASFDAPATPRAGPPTPRAPGAGAAAAGSGWGAGGAGGPTAHAPHVPRSADLHIDGVTCSYTVLPETRKLRYVQLQLVRPVAKLKAYSLRQVQVVGPRLAEARPWSSRNQKDGDSAAEGGVLTRLSRAVSTSWSAYRDARLTS